MHVLVVPSWYPTTEAPLRGIYFAEQAQILHDHGLRVGVLYPEQQSLHRLTVEALRRNHFQTEWRMEKGIPTLRRHGWNVWWRVPPGVRLRVRQAVSLAHRYVDRHGLPDVIHAQSARWAGAAAARMSEHFSVPYVLTEHYSGVIRDDIFPWRWPLVETGVQHADGLAAVSSVLKESIVDDGLAAPDDIEIIPNPVRTGFFSLPTENRPSPPPFRIVTVAGLNARKKVELLLEAFAEAVGHTEASLTVIGDGPRRTALEAQAHRLGVEKQVTFRGQVSRTEVRKALWDAHTFVLSSRYETFGVALVEAMATGLPVVATRCGGPEDIVTKETGRLVPTNDPTALADALCTMREEWASYDPERIRTSVLDRYGPEPFVRRTQSFYRRARESAS